MYRFYEMLPGLLAWITIILMFVLSWLVPTGVAIFIILFDIYWLLKIVYLSFHLHSTFSKMRANLKIDWLKKLKTGDEKLVTDWKNIYHLIILPMYKEPYIVIKESFESLIKSDYPKDKFIVVLATEERAGEAARLTAEKIEQDFADKFFKFLITIHPADIPGELAGKGSNETWAAKQVQEKIIDPLKIPYENIIVSSFDIDTQTPVGFFSRLTYVFLTCPHPQRSSFQPIPLFTNNIFQSPALAQVIVFSCTFWQMMQQARPERLTTFSSHSMPFNSLAEIGFWDTTIVSEDSHIFFKFFLYYHANWRVVPLFYPVKMDATAAPKFWQAMVGLYKQQRRWAWGCQDIAYLLNGFVKEKSRRHAGKTSDSSAKISFWEKLYWGFNTIEGFYSWATSALMIFALGWLPLILGGSIFNLSLLSYNLPQVTQVIMTMAMVGIVTSVVLSIILLPPRPSWFKKYHYLFYFLQWLLTPITLIVFGALPGLEAQTRLMLGGRFRLGFWFTPKHR